MRKRILTLIVLFAFVFALAGCYTNNHIIGNGPKENTVLSEKQWYILWGLVPINTVDTNKMAGNVGDYKITTQHSFVDVIISAITGIVTVSVKSVTVTK